MFNPKVVIFDFFGTLVPGLPRPEYKAVLSEMAGIMGAPAAAFVQKWQATFTQRVTGQFPSAQANIEAICAALAIPFDASQCERSLTIRYAYVRRHVIPRPSAVQALREIRARGLKIGLISDCSWELPELWRETAFAAWFNVAVFSCVVKLKKPNAAIYRRAADELGVQCPECLYVGDGGSNELTGAEAVGMQPVLLFAPEEQEGKDTHRVDAQPWTGPKIADLAEILTLLPAREPNTK